MGKRKTKLYIFCILTVLFMILPTALTTVEAVTPSYDNVSSYYKDSKYYDRLAAVSLTGDQRYDVVSIAISQLGYHEGNSDAEMDGLNVKGTKNYVEFNHIYGSPSTSEPGDTESYGFYWCAAFVSWCLRQARVPTDVITTEISCQRFIKWIKAQTNGTVYKTRAGGYEPLTGDMIFFNDAGSGVTSTHVGLVVGTDSSYVYTIEGNSGDRVNYHVYAKNDSYIVGYGVPNYTVKEGTVYCFPHTTGYVEPGLYRIVSTVGLNLRESPSTSAKLICNIPDGTNIIITNSAVGGSDNSWAQATYNGQSGWVSYRDYTQFVNDITYTVSYHGNGGWDSPLDMRKSLGATVIIPTQVPTRAGYTFLGWSTAATAKAVDYMPGAEYRTDADLDLYAVWQYQGIEVTFLDSDGTVISKNYYKEGEKITVPDNPVKSDADGYSCTFVGWDSEPDEVAESNRVYTAVYESKAISDGAPSDTTALDTDAVPVVAAPHSGCAGGGEGSAVSVTDIAAAGICIFTALCGLAIVKKFM